MQIGSILENVQIAMGFVPVDLASAAQSGDWVSLKNFKRVLVLLVKAAGAAGEDLTLTLQQATDAAGAGAKALTVERFYKKVGADIFTVGQFTAVDQAAANTVTAADLDGQGFVAVEIDASMLDVSGGFCFIRGTVADVGVTAQLAGLIYIATEARFAQASPPSIIS